MLTAGGGLAFATTRNLPINPEPVIVPHATFSLLFPFGKNFRLEVGVGGQRHGYKSFSSRQGFDTAGRATWWTDGAMMVSRDYLTLPLQLSGRIGHWHNNNLWIGGGITYGLLLRSYAEEQQKIFQQNQLILDTRIFQDYRIGLSQSVRKPVDLLMFNPAVNLQATYQYSTRYVVRVFYDYSLYDANAARNKGASSLKTHLIGLSVGMILN